MTYPGDKDMKMESAPPEEKPPTAAEKRRLDWAKDHGFKTDDAHTKEVLSGANRATRRKLLAQAKKNNWRKR